MSGTPSTDIVRSARQVRLVPVPDSCSAAKRLLFNRLVDMPELVPCVRRLHRTRLRHSDDAHHSFIFVTQDVAVEHESFRYIATKPHEQPNLAGRYRVVL